MTKNVAKTCVTVIEKVVTARGNYAETNIDRRILRPKTATEANEAMQDDTTRAESQWGKWARRCCNADCKVSRREATHGAIEWPRTQGTTSLLVDGRRILATKSPQSVETSTTTGR